MIVLFYYFVDMKHTDKYYIKRITDILNKNGYAELRKTFRSRCTPEDRWVYVEFNWQRSFQSRSREKLLEELKLLFN